MPPPAQAKPALLPLPSYACEPAVVHPLGNPVSFHAQGSSSATPGGVGTPASPSEIHFHKHQQLRVVARGVDPKEHACVIADAGNVVSSTRHDAQDLLNRAEQQIARTHTHTHSMKPKMLRFRPNIRSVLQSNSCSEDFESETYKYKDLQDLKFPALPKDSVGHRSWRNAVLRYPASLDFHCQRLNGHHRLYKTRKALELGGLSHSLGFRYGLISPRPHCFTAALFLLLLRRGPIFVACLAALLGLVLNFSVLYWLVLTPTPIRGGSSSSLL